MGILAIVAVWPLLLLMFGVLCLSAYDVGGLAIVFPAVIFLLFYELWLSKRMGAGAQFLSADDNDIDRFRRGVVSFSIALLLPIFIKYLFDVMQAGIPSIIIGFIIAFGVVFWGMFTKHNRVLMYANLFGGFFSLFYLYLKLWNLGSLAQVVGAAFGLVVAVAISIIKFRDKLA